MRKVFFSSLQYEDNRLNYQELAQHEEILYIYHNNENEIEADKFVRKTGLS